MQRECDRVYVSDTVEDVEFAVRSLNVSKCLDCKKLCMSHVLLAHPAIHCCLALLFNAINIYGYVPNQLGLSVVFPTLKRSTKLINNIENCRPISIMLVTGKVSEKYIANIIEPYFVFQENQFGFVKNGGCGRALVAFRNVVGYFKEEVKCCVVRLICLRFLTG